MTHRIDPSRFPFIFFIIFFSLISGLSTMPLFWVHQWECWCSWEDVKTRHRYRSEQRADIRPGYASFRHTNTHINANNCEWTNEDGTQYMEMVTSNHINELKWDGITANRKASYSVMVHIHILPPPMWPYFIVAIQCKCYPHIQRTTIINVHCANGVDHATRCWLHSSVSMVSMIQHIVSHSCRSLAAAHFYTSHYYYCYFYFFHFYFLHR